MASVRYTLEIYAPGSAYDVIGVLKADAPFGPLSAGDLFHPPVVQWTKTDALRITCLEHMMIGGGDRGYEHKTCVFTEEINDTPELRLKR